MANMFPSHCSRRWQYITAPNVVCVSGTGRSLCLSFVDIELRESEHLRCGERLSRSALCNSTLGPPSTVSWLKSRVRLEFGSFLGIVCWVFFLRAQVCLWVHFCCRQASPCTAAQACPGGGSLGGRSLSSQRLTKSY